MSKGIEGSNPSLTAIKQKSPANAGLFCLIVARGIWMRTPFEPEAAKLPETSERSEANPSQIFTLNLLCAQPYSSV
ncbi:hypothetical protein AWR36_015670 [Microbulbifer flavimaris]|uniref:Transposase n=1 Tax=Microbulbifer flavimaris TaxID=1781068 RepID=A0ABX4HWB5_9GAMM|nr:MULTISPECIES: hypothetical protein [Microbulbifer]PCO04118.1 hypothetical protein AWR36_015670 [Microbulbifer flavimaris]